MLSFTIILLHLFIFLWIPVFTAQLYCVLHPCVFGRSSWMVCSQFHSTFITINPFFIFLHNSNVSFSFSIIYVILVTLWVWWRTNFSIIMHYYRHVLILQVCFSSIVAVWDHLPLRITKSFICLEYGSGIFLTVPFGMLVAQLVFLAGVPQVNFSKRH